MPSGLATVPEVSGSYSRAVSTRAYRRAIRSSEGASAAWSLGGGPFSRAPSGRTAAQKAGLRYERAIKARLELLFDNFKPGPWFAYRTTEGLRYCQPDGLAFLNDLLVIFEIKSRFVPEAVEQLVKLYAPVVRLVHQPARLALVTICRSFDPATICEPRPLLLSNLETASLGALGAGVGVYPWRF